MTVITRMNRILVKEDISPQELTSALHTFVEGKTDLPQNIKLGMLQFAFYLEGFKYGYDHNLSSDEIVNLNMFLSNIVLSEEDIIKEDDPILFAEKYSQLCRALVTVKRILISLS